MFQLYRLLALVILAGDFVGGQGCPPPETVAWMPDKPPDLFFTLELDPNTLGSDPFDATENRKGGCGLEIISYEKFIIKSRRVYPYDLFDVLKLCLKVKFAASVRAEYVVRKYLMGPSSKLATTVTGTFLTPEDALKALFSDDTTHFYSIPSGRKINVYFTINNKENMQRRKDKNSSEFPDDCGVWKWQTGSTLKAYYLWDSLQAVLLNQGVYCVDKTVDGKRMKVALDPQPEEVNSGSDGFKPYPTQPSFTPVETSQQKTAGPPPPTNPTAEDYKNFDIVRATQYGVYERVVQLIEDGYDVNQPDAENVSVLHWAAINNRKDIAKYYIDRGASIDKIGGDLNSTPLHWATRQGHLSMVVLLISYGADPSIFDGEGCACIHLAAQFGHTAIVAYIIAKGTDVNATDKNGMTALMWSSYRVFSVDPTRLLLTFGASLTLTDVRQGNNALHWGCTSANYAAVRLLIDKGATLTERNIKGQTCLDLCAEKKSQWIIEKILKAMAAQGIGNEMKKEMGVFGKIATNKTMKESVVKVTPFVMIFLIGYICNLDAHWWQKGLLFVAAGFLWRLVSSLFFDHNVILTMSLYLYLATKFWMYITWFFYYWPYVQDWSIQIPFAINTVCLAYYFIKVWKTDPGIIKNDREGKFKVVLELAETSKLDFAQFCSTCIVRKPIRSKHCSMCNQCIARFDHHCPWVGNCIGAKNQKYFVGYLFFLMGMISWCFAGAVIYFSRACSTLNFEADGVFISAGRLMQCNAWVSWIAFNAAVHFLWVGTILAAQLYQTVYLGVTTNEKINFSKYSKFHTNKKGVYKSPYHRGIIQNFVDLMEIRCFGLCRPAKVDWLTLYDEGSSNII